MTRLLHKAIRAAPPYSRMTTVHGLWVAGLAWAKAEIFLDLSVDLELGILLVRSAGLARDKGGIHPGLPVDRGWARVAAWVG